MAQRIASPRPGAILLSSAGADEVSREPSNHRRLQSLSGEEADAKAKKIRVLLEELNEAIEDLRMRKADADEMREAGEIPLNFTEADEHELEGLQTTAERFQVDLKTLAPDLIEEPILSIPSATMSPLSPPCRLSSGNPSRAVSRAPALAVFFSRSMVHYDPDVDELGNGAAGTVYKATWQGEDNQFIKQGEHVAVKRLMMNAVAMANEEVTQLTALSHKNVVKFLGVCRYDTISGPTVLLVTEFCEGGSLQKYLQDSDKELGHGKLLNWALDIASGVQYLHSGASAKSIVHRDLKSGNVLIGSDFEGNETLKLCDFGSSISIAEWKQSTMNEGGVGTPAWMAPEIIRMESDNDISSACDIYSMGVVFWEMLTRKIPFEGVSAVRVIMMVGQGGYSLPLPEQTPTDVRELVSQCMSQKPSERPTADDVVDRIKAIKDDKHSFAKMAKLLDDRSEWVESLMKDVANEAKEKQKLSENLAKYQIAMTLMFILMMMMFIYFVQPSEDVRTIQAAQRAFDKYKGDDEKLNISELKLAFDMLIRQHQLPEDSVDDMRRILESYDVHDSFIGDANSLDAEEFTLAVNTESTLYGQLRQWVSALLKALFGWENVSIGNELRELKEVFGGQIMFFVGIILLEGSTKNIIHSTAASPEFLTIGPITTWKVLNVAVLIAGAIILATAVTSEITGAEIFERVLQILSVTLIFLTAFRWRQSKRIFGMPIHF